MGAVSANPPPKQWDDLQSVQGEEMWNAQVASLRTPIEKRNAGPAIGHSNAVGRVTDHQSSSQRAGKEEEQPRTPGHELGTLQSGSPRQHEQRPNHCIHYRIDANENAHGAKQNAIQQRGGVVVRGFPTCGLTRNDQQFHSHAHHQGPTQPTLVPLIFEPVEEPAKRETVEQYGKRKLQGLYPGIDSRYCALRCGPKQKEYYGKGYIDPTEHCQVPVSAMELQQKITHAPTLTNKGKPFAAGNTTTSRWGPKGR